ncbi:sestrin-1 isoform X3 [Lingula anatina]|uniref:Sestrin-1 isoform X3 n=1 Tax=Lingula anatina TaxID=7574 RepID=A0A1S3J1I3_LINAN|nr:sestrin-1 isoform X3 [Lingula anatina]|eukprot:XP_013403679.1 sestrin-1 isoform X3 [Lingula anatina]
MVVSIGWIEDSPWVLSLYVTLCVPTLAGTSWGWTSAYSDRIVPVDTDDEETQMLFVDAFLQNNRLEHIVQVMGYHPKYLDSFLKTQQYILRGDGPLPYDYRHYIAIMASARHQCSYLINLHKTEFLLCGGEETWLKGLDHIPQKLRDLYEIIKILAHRPWLISKNHIEKLTRGNDNWSLAEVMHALIIIAHFHAMCSFVYGCGIHPEIDEENGHTFRPSSSSDSEDNHSSSNSHSGSPTSTDAAAGIEALMERMKQLNETGEEPTQEEMLARFQKVESQSLELEAGKSQLSPKASILCYVEDPSFGYEDFAMRGAVQEIPTFRAQDFSWEDQGYSLANRLYSDIGTLLDDKFNTAYNLTYFTMGPNTDVDTSSFRRAIWNYIHCMYGIRHDDYNYGEVNHLLERYLKSYVKTVTCYPERVSKKDYDNFMRGFKHSEKVHVNLMLLEAKMQAELLYSLRALTRYMT